MGQDSKMSGDNKVGAVAIIAAVVFLVSIVVNAFGLADRNSDRQTNEVRYLTEACDGAENVPECIVLTKEALDD